MPLGDTPVLNLLAPDRVSQSGVDHGGPLKLYHRSDPDNQLPTVGEYIVVKWPSYTQWAGIGCRAANKTEYWLLRVEEEPKEGSRWWTCKLIRSIEPGRRRSLVRELVEECDQLYAKEGA